MMQASNPWLRVLRQGERPRARLVCLPHAGGSASFFRPWLAHLPADIDLLAAQYPGREERFSEPCVPCLATLAHQISEALLALPHSPVLLFGHSMGAAIAYEVAVHLEQAGQGVSHVFVSAHPPPHRQPDSDLHRQDDASLIADIRRQADDAASHWDDPQVRALFLPMVRSDYQAIETWGRQHLHALAAPLDVLLAQADQEVSLAQASAWRDLTRHTPDIQLFDGHHFYLRQQPRQVIDHLLRRAASSLGAQP